MIIRSESISVVFVVEFGPQQISDLYLRHIVNYKLVVKQSSSVPAGGLPRTHRDSNAVVQGHCVVGARGSASDTLGRILAWRQI